MFEKLIKGIKAKLYKLFADFDGSLEKRYDARIREAEEVFQRIETRIKGDKTPDFDAMTKSFDVLSKLTLDFDTQRIKVMSIVESQFPDKKNSFFDMVEAVEFLKNEYLREKNKAY